MRLKYCPNVLATDYILGQNIIMIDLWKMYWEEGKTSDKNITRIEAGDNKELNGGSSLQLLQSRMDEFYKYRSKEIWQENLGKGGF